ncbi:MAG: DUF4288 domain-containing protein [Chitinophagaceae bacterium]|nr:DUF4288 domain-containing protein [Chitinophagaceae bacterium]
MNWYMTKIVYRIICGDGAHKAQFEEQLRLIEAPDKKAAFEKARAIGTEYECSFINQKQQPVKWEFINIAELYKLPSLSDGTEIHSRLSEADHAATFIDITNKKAEFILSSVIEMTPELI